MSHKTLAKIAIIMVVVFGAIVISYPLLFNSQVAPADKPAAQSQPGPDDLKAPPQHL